MKIILSISVFCFLFSCNDLQNHSRDGTYENSIFGIERKLVLNGNNAKISSSATGTAERKVQQFEDRIEYIEDNGNTTIYYFLENGDMKVNDYIIFHKVPGVD